MSKDDITQKYDFDERQADYYTSAALYLGLVEKNNAKGVKYTLSAPGKKILSYSFKNRQLAYCKCILSHRVFAKTLEKYFNSGEMPSKREVVDIMKDSDLFNVKSDETFERRSSTVKSWLNWIVGLINE